MKVLMATDGSKDSTLAMISACRLLRKDNLQVDVLCVAPELVMSRDEDAPHADRKRIRDIYRQRVTRQSRQVLARAEHELRKEKIHAGMLMRFGSAADVILDMALDYDLVVLGAHGRDERRQPGLGPISSSVLQHATRSVLIGRDVSDDATRRILVAFDGSDASVKALAALPDYFDVGSLDATVVDVVEIPWTEPDDEPSELEVDPYEIPDPEQSVLRELREDAAAIVEQAEGQLERWGIPTTAIIEEGDPALELTSHAEEGGYDLIVAGATGATDLKHAMLGSVSLKLAWNAPCSVLVVRE